MVCSRDGLKRRIRISNSEKICVRILAARCARGLRQIHPRREQRAQGKPGADRTRGRAPKNARVDHRFNRITPAFPARMVYGLLRTLPGEPSSFATVALRMTDAYRTRSGGYISAKLDASVGRQDHTTSPSATVSAKGLAGP